MSDKSHDQRLLDVWATGYASGRINTLIQQMGVPYDLAKTVITREIGDMTDDPAFTDELLSVLRRVEDTPLGVDLGPAQWIDIHGH